MPALQNARQERFCQLRLEGKTLEQAYAGAGYKPDKGAASRMAKKPDIQNRMQELHVKALGRTEVTVESMMEQFDEDRRFAIKLKNAGAAHAASVSKAKLFGLMTEKQSVQVTHSYATMSEEELRFEIAAIHAEARALKPGVQN
jgi:phage terminase small subunit